MNETFRIGDYVRYSPRPKKELKELIIGHVYKISSVRQYGCDDYYIGLRTADETRVIGWGFVYSARDFTPATGYAAYAAGHRGWRSE